MDELWRRSAGELADLVRTREVSSREVVEAHLERIAAVNPRVNALVEVLVDEARAAAAEADQRVAAGDPLGPLHGVPVTVKQNIDVAGTATTLGLKALAQAVAPVDGPPVEALRSAGAIVLGRSNMPDVALRWHTDSDLAGPTLNPWDAAVSPGGSSGGEAVALATGMSPLGVGTDLGGSVRVPAAACGIASLKVTLGRVADASLVAPPPSPALQLMDTTGPLARTVADLRLALDVLRRPSDRDTRYRDEPLPGPPLPARLHVVVPEGTHADVVAAIERAAGALEAAGWVVDDSEGPGLARAGELWLAVLGRDVVEQLPMLRELCGADAVAFLDLMATVIPPLDDEAAAAVLAERDDLRRQWAEYQQRVPIVLAPVFAQPTFAAAVDLTDPLGVAQSIACVPPVNLLGLPATVVPGGRTGSGLPIGVELIGPAWREDVCLDAAAAVEAALGTLTPIDPR